jgi:hypothetical protein
MIRYVHMQKSSRNHGTYIVDLSCCKICMEYVSKETTKCNMENKEFIHTVEELQNRLEDKDFEIMAIVARNIWLRRNSIIFGGIFSHPNQIV